MQQQRQKMNYWEIIQRNKSEKKEEKSLSLDIT